MNTDSKQIIHDFFTNRFQDKLANTMCVIVTPPPHLSWVKLFSLFWGNTCLLSYSQHGALDQVGSGGEACLALLFLGT